MSKEKILSLSQEYLNECFDYDDGKIIWKERPLKHFTSGGPHKNFNKRYAGKEAFTNVNKTTGYRQGMVDGAVILRHYVVFVMHKGYHPKRSIKHRDKNKTNDAISNLYEVGNAEA